MTAIGEQRVMADADRARQDRPATDRRGLMSGLSFVGAIPRHRSVGGMLAIFLLTSCAAVLPPVLKESSVPPRKTAVVPLPKAKPAMPELAETARPVAQVDPGAELDKPTANGLSSDHLPPAPAVVVASPPAADQRPTARPSSTPDTLVGLDQNQTMRLLGMPASTEEAPPAKVWRYASGECTLKVFFFMDMTSSQDFRALSYNMTSSENVPDIDTRCFAQFIAHAGDYRFDR